MILFTDDMTLFVENCKKSIKKQLKLINEFNEATGYKVKTQISSVCIYNSNEQPENKLGKLFY